MAAKKGRPEKPSDDTKSEMLRIRVTPEQKAELQAAADADALDLGTWLRQLGLKTARARKG
jgi:uncharacterized protein (DUF1778 family)